MNWRTLVLMGILSFLVLILVLPDADAQEAAPAESPAAEQVDPTVPSRDNNFNLPHVIRYNGEVVTEGFWIFTMCGRPVLVVYDTEDQMALPIFGQNLFALYQQQPWNTEGAPPALPLWDLAQIYAPIRDACETIRGHERQYEEQREAPPTRMQ